MEPTECIYYYSSSIKRPGFCTIKDSFQFQSNLKHTPLNMDWGMAMSLHRTVSRKWKLQRNTAAPEAGSQGRTRDWPRTEWGVLPTGHLAPSTEHGSRQQTHEPGAPGTVPAHSPGARQPPGSAGLRWEPTRWVRVQCSSVQSLSRVRLLVTPRTAACQASLPITNSRSLLKLTPIESVMLVSNAKSFE